MRRMPTDPFRNERDEEVVARVAGLNPQERAQAEALVRSSGDRRLLGD